MGLNESRLRRLGRSRSRRRNSRSVPSSTNTVGESSQQGEHSAQLFSQSQPHPLASSTSPDTDLVFPDLPPLEVDDSPFSFSSLSSSQDQTTQSATSSEHPSMQPDEGSLARMQILNLLNQANSAEESSTTPTNGNASSNSTAPGAQSPRRPLYIISYVTPGDATDAPPSSDDTTPRSRRRVFFLVLGGVPSTADGQPGDEDGFQALLNRLLELHEPRGPPPVSQEALQNLVQVVADEALLQQYTKCPVCFDDLELGRVMVKLPCAHLFDKDCIEPWLKMHNTCPVCRYELPVDDPEYEKQRQERMASRNANLFATSQQDDQPNNTSETSSASSSSSERAEHSPRKRGSPNPESSQSKRQRL